MNYIYEDNINFNETIMQELCSNEKIKHENLCLISSTPLNKNHIELICKHKFNYQYILNEVINQKINKNILEIQKLKSNQIKCPYCRNIQNKILPHILPFAKIKFVNSPLLFSMTNNKCTYKFKSGKRKGLTCDIGFWKYNNISYCHKHCKSENKLIQICSAIIKTGKRKGKQCTYKISTTDGFCKIHTKLTTEEIKAKELKDMGAPLTLEPEPEPELLPPLSYTVCECMGAPLTPTPAPGVLHGAAGPSGYNALIPALIPPADPFTPVCY